MKKQSAPERTRNGLVQPVIMRGDLCTLKQLCLGNLGRDPETRYTQGGRMNVSFSIASSRRYTDCEWNPSGKDYLVSGYCMGKAR